VVNDFWAGADPRRFGGPRAISRNYKKERAKLPGYKGPGKDGDEPIIIQEREGEKVSTRESKRGQTSGKKATRVILKSAIKNHHHPE